eukprot:COSAG01_NODE_3826_length_5656_cov_12.085478_5_plen_98_part_00
MRAENRKAGSRLGVAGHSDGISGSPAKTPRIWGRGLVAAPAAGVLFLSEDCEQQYDLHDLLKQLTVDLDFRNFIGACSGCKGRSAPITSHKAAAWVA